MSSQPSQISIGSQILLGADDVNDVEWGFSTIDGWHKPTGVDVDRVQRIVSHGEFAQHGHRTGRVITVTGWLWADTRAKINTALLHLSALLADGGFDTFTFDDSDSGELSTEVQLLDLDADWDTGTVGNPPRFQLQLLATSPYKFGATDSDTAAIGGGPVVAGVGLHFPLFTGGPSDGFLYFGGAVTPPDPPGIATVSNPGTADASVILTVAGPTPAEGFTMTDFDTNLSVTYLGPAIQAGSELVFNGADGTVLSDGSDVSGYAVVEAWPVVPAGGDLTVLFQSLGEDTGAELTLSCAATYW